MVKKDEIAALKDMYTEVGINYRFFLNWRHALFAGYLLVLYILAQSYVWLIEHNSLHISFFYATVFLFSLCFWGLECRIRDLYNICIKAGIKIEEKFGEFGVYAALASDEVKNKRITHSRVLNWFFGIISFGMFVMLIISLREIFK